MRAVSKPWVRNKLDIPQRKCIFSITFSLERLWITCLWVTLVYGVSRNHFHCGWTRRACFHRWPNSRDQCAVRAAFLSPFYDWHVFPLGTVYQITYYKLGSAFAKHLTSLKLFTFDKTGGRNYKDFSILDWIMKFCIKICLKTHGWIKKWKYPWCFTGRGEVYPAKEKT